MKYMIADFLSRKPQLGFISSMLTITLTHLQILQIIGAILGIVIAVITAILKVIELRDKLEEKKTGKKKVRKKPTRKVNSDEPEEE